MFDTIENVNGGGIGGQKKTNLVNVVCERPLMKKCINALINWLTLQTLNQTSSAFSIMH